jgi:adenosylcobyric acid synthase
MTARVLMIQGTSSSVGKSLLTAALARIFTRNGLRVAPFKAQNMSNNAAVCGDGAEIGRAQAVQAAAAGIEPTADMNPILLKPEADARCQVIVDGRPWRTLPAGAFYRRRDELWPIVTAALDRLRAAFDLVVIEGAGSPAELNLRAADIVNMAVARHAGSPVLLVGDIDRGGIFAQLLGTLWLLPEEDRCLVRGLIVNKFRGDPALFADGVRILEERGRAPVLGVVPYLTIAIPEEDSVALDSISHRPHREEIDVAVIRLPRIANFDDFDPLCAEPGVRVRYVSSAASLGRPHAIILPGTKSTLADLAWVHEQRLGEAIRQAADRGSVVVGICGGYQMLGMLIRDPTRVESSRGEADGLGLLPVRTVFEHAKSTYQVKARVIGGPSWMETVAGQEVSGYEIHMGRSLGGRAWLRLTARNGQPVDAADGAVSENGRIWGSYLHGLFANVALRREWLRSLAPASGGCKPPESPEQSAGLDQALDDLAEAVERTLDMERLTRIISCEH